MYQSSKRCCKTVLRRVLRTLLLRLNHGTSPVSRVRTLAYTAREIIYSRTPLFEYVLLLLGTFLKILFDFQFCHYIFPGSFSLYKDVEFLEALEEINGRK